MGKSAVLSRFTLITGDLDDTLWPCLPPIVRAEEAVYAWLGRVAERVVAVHDLESLRAAVSVLYRSLPSSADDELLEPVAADPAPRGLALVVEPGVAAVRAPEVWAQGITGAGTVVARP